MDIDNLTIKQARDIVAFLSPTAALVPPRGPVRETPLAVLVCTDKRGVVFGYTLDESARPIALTNARMCLYWSTDVGGVFGLAEIGPTTGCKISAPVPGIALEGVTAVMSVDATAAKAWEKAPVQGR